MTRIVRMPSAAAPSRSDWSAMRLRSRQVICMTGSSPAASTARLPAQLASRTFEPWLSVMLTASTQPRSNVAARVIGSVLAPRGGLISAVTAKLPDARRSRRLTGPPRAVAGLAGPQSLVAALPVVQPRALAPAAVVRRAVQQAQVGGPALARRALVGVDPDAGQRRVHLAGAVRAHSPARPVTQLLRAAHRAGVAGDGQGALAAHPAAEQVLFDQPLRAGERGARRARRLDPGAEPAPARVGAQHPLQPVRHADAQVRAGGDGRPGGHQASRDRRKETTAETNCEWREFTRRGKGNRHPILAILGVQGRESNDDRHKLSGGRLSRRTSPIPAKAD